MPEEQELADVYHDKSDVVLLSHRSGLPCANLGDQSVCQFRRWAHLGAENNLFELSVTEWLASAIFRFKQPIGAEEKPVAGADGYVANRIVGLRCHPEN